jgi:hypothetical protein
VIDVCGVHHRTGSGLGPIVPELVTEDFTPFPPEGLTLLYYLGLLNDSKKVCQLTPRSPLKETIGVKLDNLYRRMGIDVEQTFKQLDLSPINVLQTNRNIGLLSLSSIIAN